MIDDRQAFAASQLENAESLANDQQVQKKNIELYNLVDKHDYSYLWNWMGVPIIQNPTDILVMQEIIWKSKPDVIIETGVARGGSVVMYASILEMLGHGLVVGIDVDIRKHNRDTIETHLMGKRIKLIEGSSTDKSTLDEVLSYVEGDKKVMVILDSNHTHEHVLKELEIYAPLVKRGQYLVVADTCVEYIEPSLHRGSARGAEATTPKLQWMFI
ncbi:CmcI family methyltransferase [Alteromonas gracilis]|uniref:CmcI family methyltransferase n=1 Tax=Alteromonas gracilis TaxID=1479524 RepID=UPI0030D0A71C